MSQIAFLLPTSCDLKTQTYSLCMRKHPPCSAVFWRCKFKNKSVIFFFPKEGAAKGEHTCSLPLLVIVSLQMDNSEYKLQKLEASADWAHKIHKYLHKLNLFSGAIAEERIFKNASSIQTQADLTSSRGSNVRNVRKSICRKLGAVPGFIPVNTWSISAESTGLLVWIGLLEIG